MVSIDKSMDAVIGLIVSIIMIVAIALPIVLDIVANTTATGTTLLILGFLGIFLALAALVVIVSAIKVIARQ